jgi:hypothetical protein
VGTTTAILFRGRGLLEPENGGPQQRGVNGDYADGNLAKEIGETSLGCEGSHEGAVLQLWNQSGRKAASKIDAACRKNLERQVARLSAPDIDEDAQCLGRERIVVRVAERSVQDQRSPVRDRMKRRPELCAFRRRIARADVIVNVLDSGPRAHTLVAGVAKTIGEIGPESGLNVVGRREIGVAALGGTGEIALACPYQKRLAETRTRR